MKLYNSLSQQTEEFIPLNDKQVTMYVCGITPYDTTHLGHAFTYIFFDTLLRYLKFQGNEITYTQNVTDINDRDNDILKRAKEQNVAWDKLAEYWTNLFLTDMKTLNWVMPNNFLWASKQIPQMVHIIQQLLANGLAYQVNGGVYLDVEIFKDFGKLSRFAKEKMLQVAKEFEEDLDNPDKRHLLDITLWRPTLSNQPGHIPSFDSPFGKGRPGWHLECSAMAISSLGEQIDIHGGGIDLLYPHHESEVAQSEGATNKQPFAKYWIHTAPVRYQGEKMSKSLGNLVLVSNLLKTYSANTIRFMLLSHHYRETWEFHDDEMKKAQEQVKIIEQALKNTNVIANPAQLGEAIPSSINNPYEQQFIAAMDDDMNTPEALQILIRLAKETNGKETLSKLFTTLGFTI